MKWTYALISCLLLSKAAIAGSQQQQKQTFKAGKFQILFVLLGLRLDNLVNFDQFF